jgi:mutator protein MutT
MPPKQARLLERREGRESGVQRNADHVTVAAGAIWREDGRLLVSRRPEGKRHAGFWELPGGKVEPGESVLEALEREAREELAVEVHADREFARVTHDYGDLVVTLVGVHARHLRGEPRAVEVADFRWVLPEELAELRFPAANAALLAGTSLRLPAGLFAAR